MIQITLPPRHDGSRLTLERNTRRMVIIGANGAGKTRFTRRLAADMADRATTLSALTAIFSKSAASAHDTFVDRLYAPIAGTADPRMREAEASQFEKLVALLMHDEMVNLLDYKLHRASDPTAVLDETTLDRVIAIWNEIFPDNHILVESGKLLFSRGDDAYSSPRLSTGEQATFYYIAATLYIPAGSLILIENPELFLHPSVLQALWNRLENERRDCVFAYTTHDLEFAGSRSATTVWVRDCDVAAERWGYDILAPRQGIPDEVYMAILGSRKPIIFIEGDAEHSIDAKFYPLIFKDYTVKSMGSCNKVIEATRSFNDLAAFHHLDSHGIVDRDRRDEKEVDYLRRKKVFVPDVAEIENLLMLEEVVRTVAEHCGKNADYVFGHVRSTIISLFRAELEQQALQHTRHRMKRFMECRIDGRFADIDMLEEHLRQIPREFNARKLYQDYCSDFRRYVNDEDYAMVLRVYNQKSMLPQSNVAPLCGMTGGKDQYVSTVIGILRHGGERADRIRQAVLRCFGLVDAPDGSEIPAAPPAAEAAEAAPPTETIAAKLARQADEPPHRRRNADGEAAGNPFPHKRKRWRPKRRDNRRF